MLYYLQTARNADRAGGSSGGGLVVFLHILHAEAGWLIRYKAV